MLRQQSTWLSCKTHWGCQISHGKNCEGLMFRDISPIPYVVPWWHSRKVRISSVIHGNKVSHLCQLFLYGYTVHLKCWRPSPWFVYVFNLRRKEISTHEKRDILVQMNKIRQNTYSTGHVNWNHVQWTYVKTEKRKGGEENWQQLSSILSFLKSERTWDKHCCKTNGAFSTVQVI